MVGPVQVDVLASAFSDGQGEKRPLKSKPGHSNKACHMFEKDITLS